MLESIPLSKILVLDIETVPQYPTYQSMSEKWQKLWDKKAQFLKKNEEDTAETIYPRAGIYAEFGKIICVSAGIFIRSGNFWQFKVKSFYGDDEKILLGEFIQMLQKFNTTNDQLLCGHNAKEFDFPYLCRRMLINGLEIPSILNIAGKKPWEVQHIDTMDLWKFGDIKNFSSLNLLAHVFGIPSPKDDIDGSMVAKTYYEDKQLEKIVTYCKKDVITLARVYQRFIGSGNLNEEDITFVDE